MKLRNMSAQVDLYDNYTVVCDGVKLDMTNVYVLTSYSSQVAAFDGNVVYLLPRYDYSVTTMRHLHAFIQDYCCHVVPDMPIAAIRKEAKYGAMYRFAE